MPMAILRVAQRVRPQRIVGLLNQEEDIESTARSGAVMMGMEDPGEGRVDFHVKRANALWNDGYVTSAGIAFGAARIAAATVID